MNEQNVKLKQIKNLFNALNTNSNSMFYGADRISKNLISNGRKPFYVKDKVLAKPHNELEIYIYIYIYMHIYWRRNIFSKYICTKKYVIFDVHSGHIQ